MRNKIHASIATAGALAAVLLAASAGSALAAPATAQAASLPKTTVLSTSQTTAANGKVTVRVTAKKVKGAGGYQAKAWVKKSCKGTAVATSTATSPARLKLAGLKLGSRYYVKVRAYRIVSAKKTYSSWSKIKAVTTKAPAPKPPSVDVEEPTFELDLPVAGLDKLSQLSTADVNAVKKRIRSSYGSTIISGRQSVEITGAAQDGSGWKVYIDVTSYADGVAYGVQHRTLTVSAGVVTSNVLCTHDSTHAEIVSADMVVESAYAAAAEEGTVVTVGGYTYSPTSCTFVPYDWAAAKETQWFKDNIRSGYGSYAYTSVPVLYKVCDLCGSQVEPCGTFSDELGTIASIYPLGTLSNSEWTCFPFKAEIYFAPQTLEGRS